MRVLRILTGLSLLVVGAWAASPAQQPDAAAIIQRSVAIDQMNWEVAKDYAFVEEVKVQKVDKGGAREMDEWRKYDVTLVDGAPYRRLIAKNGKPLPAEEERKEQEKLDKSIQKQLKMSGEDHARRRQKAEEQRRRGREFLKEVANAYTFSLVREERYAGHDAWVIHAEPKPDYKPKVKRAELLKKIRGTLWIDKNSYHWVKAEAETIDTASFGWFLARLAPGSKLHFEQTFVNNEAWLMHRFGINFDLKLGLLKRMRREVDVSYGEYRKFTTDSRVVSTKELE